MPGCTFWIILWPLGVLWKLMVLLGTAIILAIVVGAVFLTCTWLWERIRT